MPTPKKNKDTKMCFRDIGFDLLTKGEGENAEKVLRLSVSSEEPYYRSSMWDAKNKKWIAGWEVLGHAEGEVDFTRMKDGLIIQDTHWGDQVGLMRTPEIIDGKLCGEVEFCHGQRAQDIKADALAGLRRNMSVGYFVKEYKLDGEKDGEPIYRAVSWMPYEASFVNCPADTTVGVGRSEEGTEENPAAKPAAETKGIQIMEKPKEAGRSAEEVVEAFRLANTAHISTDEVQELLKSDKPFAEVRETLAKKVDEYVKELAKKAEKPNTPAPAGQRAEIDDAAKREIKKHYNIANVMRALAGDNTVDIGFEREVSAEVAKTTGREVRGILIPDFIRSDAGSETLARPDHGTTDGLGGSGHNTIATNLLAGSFIDALRDVLPLTKMGMQTLSGLVGDIAIPKGGKVTAAWITAEHGDASKTNPTFGQAQATPKTVGAYVDITRKLLLQSSIDVQAFVTRELIYALAHALTDAGINGSGTSGVPSGLVGQIPVGNTVSFTAGAPTLAKILEMISKIDEANGVTGKQTFLGRPSVWALLGGTLDWHAVTDTTAGTVSGVTSGKYLLDTATNTMQGYAFEKSNLAPAKSLVFGDFSQLMLCLWSGTDLVVDQYSNCTKGALRVVALQDADFIVRHPEAFSKGTTLLS